MASKDSAEGSGRRGGGSRRAYRRAVDSGVPRVSRLRRSGAAPAGRRDGQPVIPGPLPPMPGSDQPLEFIPVENVDEFDPTYLEWLRARGIFISIGGTLFRNRLVNQDDYSVAPAPPGFPAVD